MKVFAISGDEKYLKIGENFDSAVWFGFEESITDQVSAVKKRDTVTITFDELEKNKRVLTSISVTEVASEQTETTSSGKVVTKGEIMTKLAVLKSAGSAMGSMAGQVTTDNIASETIKLYKALLEEINS